MKNVFLILFLVIAFISEAQTQQDMNEDAYLEYQKSDSQLNEVYQLLLVDYKQDTLFIKNLKKAQRIWIKFRDAEMQMKFPEYKDSYDGSSHSMCKSIYLIELTNTRVSTLKKWLDGEDEGELCSGSVKIK